MLATIFTLELGACEAMHQNDKRPGKTVSRPVESSRQSIAARRGQKQPFATGQFRRAAEHDVAQSLQVAPEPGRPFPERRNRPIRYVNAVPFQRIAPQLSEVNVRSLQRQWQAIAIAN